MKRPGLVAVTSPRGDQWLELARTQKGRLYRKQILRLGNMAHPNIAGGTLPITSRTFDSLIANFNNGTCDIVQVPIVDGANKHSEDPLRNIGQVVDLERKGDKLYAVIDARRHADDLGETLIGASALMHMDYKDTVTGAKVGPTLLHVAVTNRPYVTNLEDFEEIIAASADNSIDEELMLFASDTKESGPMDLDELLALLRDEHGIDVAALQAAAELADLEDDDDDEPSGPDTRELVEALSNVLQSAGVVGLSAQQDELTIQDVANAVIELSQEKVGLEGTVLALSAKAEEQAAEAREVEVTDLIRQGRILPAKRQEMLELSAENHDLFLRLVPDTSLVSLSEHGVTVHDEVQNDKLQAAIDRYTAVMNGKKV